MSILFKSKIKDIIEYKSVKEIEDEEAKEQINLIIKTLKRKKISFDINIIHKAFLVLYYFTKDTYRLSGKPYYSHKINIANTLISETNLDENAVVACFLYDIHKDNDISNKWILNEFGNTVYEIIEGVSTINKIEDREVDTETHLENYRKLLFSLFKDIRIIFIILADRLENLRTISFLDKENQLKHAIEAREVFAPFANRIGLRNVKWELEDLAFKVTNKDKYDEIKKALLGTREEREQYVNDFKKPLRRKINSNQFLKKNEINIEISGRAKHIYSIYNKMLARQKPVDELYDLIAIRLIVDSDDENICFYVYGIVASMYPPVPDTFKDYINSPKQNGYKSIHVAVLGPRNKPVEVQIRTTKMHEVAEFGVAAHFTYKRGLVPAKSVLEQPTAIEWMNTIKEMVENEDLESTDQMLRFLKKNLYLEEIHIFSPKNELFTFPKDSTPLDFAFEIHSELGYRCIGCKANGKVVPLDYKMKSGDQITILTTEKITVSKEWLSFVRTGKAKSFINKYLKNEIKKLYNTGRKIWNIQINKLELGVNRKHLDDMLYYLGFQNDYDFFTNIGSKKLDIKYAVDTLIDIVKNRLIVDKSKVDIYKKTPSKVSLEIIGIDRPGIVSEITSKLISIGDLNLYSVSFDTKENRFIGYVSFELLDKTEYQKVEDALKDISGLNSIRKMNN